VIASRIRRPAAAPLLIAAVVFAGVLPPAHIHLAEHDDHDHDHAAAVEHSHWSAHQSSRAAFNDDDGRVIFVDRPARSADAQTTSTHELYGCRAADVRKQPARRTCARASAPSRPSFLRHAVTAVVTP
jgi:hypothetical protein